MPTDELFAREVVSRVMIGDLLARCCYLIDRVDADSWLTCFTTDAVWVSQTPAGERHFVLTGHDELREWFAVHRERTPVGAQRHLVANVQVVVDDPASAGATSSFVSVKDGDEGPFLASIGEYVDRLVRDDQGAWRIASRTSVAAMRAKRQ